MDNSHTRGAGILVKTCADLRPGEKAYIISDPATDSIADFIHIRCKEVTGQVRRDSIEAQRMHGEPPPARVGESMLWADVVFCLTSTSMAHTPERKRATDKGARFLSLPDYTLDILGGESLLFDFHGAVPFARELAGILDAGSQVRITTGRGTDLRFSIAGRAANSCPGVCLEPGALASPPDAEVNIAPLEESAEGVVCVDGSIPCRDIGALQGRQVTLRVSQGKIGAIQGDISQILERMFNETGAPAARTLGEFGIGLNPKASLTGRMLEDEGCAGTIHLGFGSNSTIGGTNVVAFHLDFVIMMPAVWVDGRRIMNGGIPEWGSEAVRAVFARRT